MIRFTMRQLEYFVATVDCASLARAAAQLHVSQPSISVAIGKLEDQLGVQLLVRHHGQGVTLTSVGRRLHVDARDLLKHARQLQLDAEGLGGAPRGELHLGCFATFAPLYLPALISSFADAYPEAQIRLREGEQDDLLAGLLAGHLDFALLYRWEVPPEIALTSLGSAQPYVLLPEGHRLARRRSLSLRQLADEPLILLDVSPSRSFFMAVFRAAGIEPRVAFTSPSIEMVRGLVGKKRGYSILVTRPPFDHTYDGERVVTRPLSEPTLSGELCLARSARVRPTRLMQVFHDHCVAWFRGENRPRQRRPRRARSSSAPTRL
ncbi:MAG: LysR family transcriptional regulator [Alphaproteobacteria bacterium]